MKRIVLVVSFMLLGNLAMAQDTAKNDALKYMEASGQMKAFEYLIDEISLNVSENQRADFKKEVIVSLGALKEKLAEMYMEEFSAQDLKELVKFYESPIGKKLNSKYDVLYEKGQLIGQEWGISLQPVIMKYLEN